MADIRKFFMEPSGEETVDRFTMTTGLFSRYH